MATLYDIKELQRIHKAGEAIEGRVYQTNTTDAKGNNQYFVGTSTGRLEAITNVTLIEDNSTNIEINQEDIDDLQAEVARLESVKANKCYALAMSIIL